MVSIKAEIDVTEISFYFNAPDKVAYACRLLRKAVNAGARSVVVGEPQTLAQLDAALWTFSPVDFIPHCFGEASTGMVAASLVLLRYGAPGNRDHIAVAALPGQILVNLGAEIPLGFEQFERLIEIVGNGDEEKTLARARWKHYAHRGYALTHHDLTTPSPPAQKAANAIV